MTIICALQVGKEVWVGSDRCRSGGHRVIMDKPKFLHRGGWSIGVAGYSRAFDVLERAGDEPPARDIWKLALWMREVLLADGFERVAKDNSGDQECVISLGSGFVVANDERVWDVDAGFAISPMPEGVLHARGSGADYALGCDYAVRSFKVPMLYAPSARVHAAVQAAIEYDPGCGGEPFFQRVRA